MNDSAALVTHTALVGSRMVTFTISGHGHFVAEWAPDMPTFLTRQERRQYRRARAKAILAASEKFGGSILVIET
jgi:hypothetical protein